MLAGMEATPAAGGAFTFRHRASGLEFAIGPAPPPAEADSDAEGSAAEPELAFQPLSLGSAAEVRPRPTSLLRRPTLESPCISFYSVGERHGRLLACLPLMSMSWTMDLTAPEATHLACPAQRVAVIGLSQRVAVAQPCAARTGQRTPDHCTRAGPATVPALGDHVCGVAAPQAASAHHGRAGQLRAAQRARRGRRWRLSRTRQRPRRRAARLRPEQRRLLASRRAVAGARAWRSRVGPRLPCPWCADIPTVTLASA